MHQTRARYACRDHQKHVSTDRLTDLPESVFIRLGSKYDWGVSMKHEYHRYNSGIEGRGGYSIDTHCADRPSDEGRFLRTNRCESITVGPICVRISIFILSYTDIPTINRIIYVCIHSDTCRSTAGQPSDRPIRDGRLIDCRTSDIDVRSG